MKLLFFGFIFLLIVLAFFGSGIVDPRDWPKEDKMAASGQCKAVRKEKGATLWKCSDGTEFWLASYRHEDKQGDWKQPKGCVQATPPDSPLIYTRSMTPEELSRYRQCPDGQSFWAK